MATYITEKMTNSLEELIFSRHNEVESDELQIVSGYIGPQPIKNLTELPIRSKVVFGMYKDQGIQKSLHTQVLNLQSEKTQIFYSNQLVHTKLYIWKYRGETVSALIGSANFSTNGLRTEFREMLMDVPVSNFNSISHYSNTVFQNTISCLEHTFIEKEEIAEDYDQEVCDLTWLDPRTGETHNAHGLNWGMNPNNHTVKGDACIPIRVDHIRKYPNLFYPKTGFSAVEGGKEQRQNDPVDVIFDDETTMICNFEGNNYPYGKDNQVYPKQLTSWPDKATFGNYFRKRLGVPQDQPVRKHHLDSYGRTSIKLSLVSEGVYFIDFSN